MSRPVVEGPERPSCDHSEVEALGNAGTVEFFRCTRCHDVVVVQGSGRWAVAAAIHEG